MTVPKVDFRRPVGLPMAARGGAQSGGLGADFSQILNAATEDHDDGRAPATPALPLTPLGSDAFQNAPLKPMSEWDFRVGVKAPDLTIKPLHNDRHPAGPMMPLTAADSVPGVRKAPKSKESQTEETARKWVAQTFYGTLFKQMRSSPFKSDLFDGGRGGQAFAPMLDQHLVDRMSRGSDRKLTNAIAKRLLGKRNGSPRTDVAKTKELRPGPEAIQPPTSAPANAAPPATDPNPFEGIRIHVAPGTRA
ncbi:MAG TPA: rod-binding protein [Tepidisphaeraceae bacterium]|nr:rod-binding protein [Tepidisphaeraceae bacterium]